MNRSYRSHLEISAYSKNSRNPPNLELIPLLQPGHTEYNFDFALMQTTIPRDVCNSDSPLGHGHNLVTNVEADRCRSHDRSRHSHCRRGHAQSRKMLLRDVDNVCVL